MTSGMELYHQLARRGWTTSQRDFSTYYLGMAANYVCLRGERAPSERAMINLFRRLWAERHHIFAARVAWLILWGAER